MTVSQGLRSSPDFSKHLITTMATVERMLERKFELDKATAHSVAAEAKKQLGLPKNVMYSKKLFDECQKIAEDKGILKDGKKVPVRTGFTFRQTRQSSNRALKVEDDDDKKQADSEPSNNKSAEAKTSTSTPATETETNDDVALERKILHKSNSQESSQSAKSSKSSSSKSTESIKSDTQHSSEEKIPLPSSSPPKEASTKDKDVNNNEDAVEGDSDTKQIAPASSPQQSKESSQESLELPADSVVDATTKTAEPKDVPDTSSPVKNQVNFAVVSEKESANRQQQLKRSGSDTELNLDKKGSSSHDRSKLKKSSRSRSSAAKLSLGDLEKLKGGSSSSPRKSKSSATSLGDFRTTSSPEKNRMSTPKLASLSDLDELKGGSMHERRSKSSATSLGDFKAKSPRRSRSGPLNLTESEIEKLKSGSSHDRKSKTKKDTPSSPGDSDKALDRKGSKSKTDRKVERNSSSNQLKKSRSRDSDASDKRNVERKSSGTNLMSTSSHGKKSRSRKEKSSDEPKEKKPIILFDGLVLEGPLPILSDNAKIHITTNQQGKPKHYSDDGVAHAAMEAREKMSKGGAPRRKSFGGISTCRWESGGSSSTAVTQLLRDTSDSHEDQGSRWKTDQMQIQQSLTEQRHMMQQIPQVPQRSRDDTDLPDQQGDREQGNSNGSNSNLPLLKPARRGSIE